MDKTIIDIEKYSEDVCKRIMENREKYVTAWIAETGLKPSECEIVEQHNFGEIVVFMRKREK